MPGSSPAPGTLYPQALRTPSSRWWKPLLGLVAVGLAVVLVLPLLLLPVLAVAVLALPGSYGTNFINSLDYTQQVLWPGLLYLNLTLAAAGASTWLAVRVIHGVRPGVLSSVTGRLRWRLLGVFTLLAFVTLLVATGVQQLLPSAVEGSSAPDAGGPGQSALAIALVLLLTTPLQAVGEEYLFRGYLMQALGSFVASRWVAILGSALVFALAHGAQNPPLFFDRFAFGVVAAYAVVRTGGLEAGIAMHVLNNLLAFAIAVATGTVTATLSPSEAGWWQIPATLVQSGLFLALVLWWVGRRPVEDRTPSLPPAEPYGAVPAGGHAPTP